MTTTTDVTLVKEVTTLTEAADRLSGEASADVLIAAIVAAGGPTYAYVEVAPSVANSTGGEPGGNIRNAYFYDPSRVTYVEGSARLITDAAFTGSRRPLVAEFVFNGETVTLINLHSTSRGGSDPQWGSTQPPSNAGDAARTAQATATRAYVDTLLAANPAAKIIVQGDFNGFTWENAISALTAGGALSNLATLLPEAERYSYQFEGNSQQLDHMLATSNLRAAAQYDAVHLNAELPAGQQLSTDHDALLAVFEILVQVVGTEGADTINGTSASEVIRALGGDDIVFGNGGNDVIYGGDGADRIHGGAGRNIIFAGAGNDFTGGDAVQGVHTIDGGAGADWYVANSAGETVRVDLTAGTVTGGYADGSTLTGIEMLRAVRGGFAVEFFGDNGANAFFGSAFDDVLSSGGGNDKITGGKGSDVISGGAGNDVFYFQKGDIDGDTIIDFDGNGAGSGDVLVFKGFGPGAMLSNIGNDWTIHYGAGLSEMFTMNVQSLAPGDVVFG